MQFSKIIIILIVLCAQTTVNAQVNMRPSVAMTYLQHSRLVGVNIGNDLIFNINKNALVVGGGINFAEGNRNFDPQREENYNLDIKGYAPQYNLGQGYSSYQYELPIELEPRTSITFQSYLKAGYQHQFDWGQLEGGAYFTYVSRKYLVDIIYDVDIEFFEFPYEADLAIPYRLRYLDAGIYLSYSKAIFKDLKVPVLAKASAFLATQHNSWYNLGLAIEI